MTDGFTEFNARSDPHLSNMSPPENRLSEHSVFHDTSTPSPHLYNVFEEAVSKHGTREAVVALHQEPHLYADSLNKEPSKGPGLRWTYNDLHRAVLRFSGSLEAHGVQKGDVVTTFVANGIEWCIVVCACWRIGAVFTPLSIRNISNAAETKYMLESAATKVLIAANAETASSLDKLAREASLSLKVRVVVDASGAPDNWVGFSSLVELNGTSDEALSKKPAAQLAGSDGAVIFFTSGTTSLPKGCQHTQQSLATVFDSRRPLWEAGPDSRAANFMPNNHAMGFIFTVALHLRGGSVVFPAGAFTPAALLNALVQERCNETVLVPTMAYALINVMSEQNIPKLGHLKSVAMGGASVSEKNLEDCWTKVGFEQVCAGYGMSEGIPMRPMLFKTPAEAVIQGSPCCGEVALGCSVKICSPGTTSAVPINTPGELHMSGPTVISGYLGGRNKEDFYVEDGKQWFKSGDQAVMDEQNRIAIVGRYKDMIIRGGENISPNAMERVLNTIDGIEVSSPDLKFDKIGTPDVLTVHIQAHVVGTVDDIAGEVCETFAPSTRRSRN